MNTSEIHDDTENEIAKESKFRRELSYRVNRVSSGNLIRANLVGIVTTHENAAFVRALAIAFGFDQAMREGGLWHEPAMLADADRVRQVCNACGSQDVNADAFAIWDVEGQEWVCSSTFDKGSCCERCGGECRIVEVPFDYDPWDYVREVDRIKVIANEPDFEVMHFKPGDTRETADSCGHFATAENANSFAGGMADKLEDCLVQHFDEEYP